jgi:hypothetical protein
VADRIADAGFFVAFPDVFRGAAWPLSKFPPPNRQELMDWIGWYDFEGKVRLGLCVCVYVKELGRRR